MADVEAAIQEMFQAPHIQVSWNLQCANTLTWHFIQIIFFPSVARFLISLDCEQSHDVKLLIYMIY
jgi:hypothetical protein